MNKFKVNEIVLYQNGERFELGVVKEVLEGNTTITVHPDSTRTKEVHTYKYRVWYHTGDTTALTDECYLHKIENAYAFNIIRKSDNKDIELSPARQLASRILGQLELYGDFYYKVEDWLTDFLEGNEHDMPYGIESEYLQMALRVEVRDYLDASDIEYDSEDVENIVNDCFDCFGVSVLNDDFIQDNVARYVADKEEE